MKAVVYDKQNTPVKLSYRDVEKPTPKDDEILVEIHAASVNAADYRMIQMGFPPKKKIFGADISGIVEAVGNNVNEFKPGDHVVGDTSDHGFGGFAEYIAAPEKAFIHKPEGISFEQAAALPLAAITALQALRNKGAVKKGQQVLIIGSSGGVGIYAVQLAKYYGAIVTGVCSSENIVQTRLLGADYVIDYNKTNLSQINERYDLILGVNGNYPLIQCKRLLKPHGQYIMVGGSLSQIFRSIFFGWMMSFGSRKMAFLTAKSNRKDIEFIVKLALEGSIKPIIDRSYHLNETPDAIQYIKEKHAKGKVMIVRR
jgi:NADPH:quinone reductase-like Zn-dependent oxidoreductase